MEWARIRTCAKTIPQLWLPEFHYLHVDETPTTNRAVDDFQPRAQMKTQFAEGTLTLTDPDKVKEFSKNYIISEELVNKYVVHFTELKVQKVKQKSRSQD